MSGDACHVLFLCTGNSARSILAEAILESIGPPRFRGSSAGSHPRKAPHPMALEVLAAHGHETSRWKSQSWDEYAGPGAPRLDVIITVCDNAAGEACPIWPGRPTTAHWGLPDPAACEGSTAEIRAAFESTYAALRRRIEAFTQEWPRPESASDGRVQGEVVADWLRRIHASG